MLDNIKHELFVQALIQNGGHKTEAYMSIYKAKYDTARHGGSFLLRNVEIRRRVSEILEAEGLGILELAKKLKKLTEARKAVTNNNDFTGWEPDNRTSLEAIKLACRLHGLIGTEKGDFLGNEVFVAPEVEEVKQIKTSIQEEE